MRPLPVSIFERAGGSHRGRIGTHRGWAADLAVGQAIVLGGLPIWWPAELDHCGADDRQRLSAPRRTRWGPLGASLSSIWNDTALHHVPARHTCADKASLYAPSALARIDLYSICDLGPQVKLFPGNPRLRNSAEWKGMFS